MRDEKHEGIVLKSLDFKDREKIITLYTPTKGLVSLIVKGITRKHSHLLTLTSPFTRGEYHFLIGKSDLYRFKDGSPLSTHQGIRKSLDHIRAATRITQSLLLSQMPEKPAPLLYNLARVYLHHLPEFDTPSLLSNSFLLKLLIHDGCLTIGRQCALCSQDASYLSEGEPHCAVHAPFRGHRFDTNEWETLEILAHTRSIEQLKGVSLTAELGEKIQGLFQKNA